MQGEAHDTQMTPANSDFEGELLLLDHYREFPDLVGVLERRGPVLMVCLEGGVHERAGLAAILEFLDK